MEEVATKQRSEVPSLKQDLYEAPYRYQFHQAAYLLEVLFKDKYLPVGEGTDALSETIKIKSRVSLSSPGSDIYSLDSDAQREFPPTMRVNFWGLAGIQGPLPQPYTEMVANRIRDHDYAMQDFFDIFNHRLISLLHRVRKKATPCLNTQEPEDSPKGMSLRALFGFKDQDTKAILGIDPKTVLPFAAFFWQHPRTAAGLKVILQSFFKTTVMIQQFYGGWLPLDEDQTTLIGLKHGRLNRLGHDAALGTRVWRAEKRVLIIMGPMNRELFNQCIPSGELYPTLVRMVRAYLPANIGFRIQLKLNGQQLSKTLLNGKSELGATSWVIGQSYKKDVDEQVFLTPQPEVFRASLEKKS